METIAEEQGQAQRQTRERQVCFAKRSFMRIILGLPMLISNQICFSSTHRGQAQQLCSLHLALMYFSTHHRLPLSGL